MAKTQNWADLNARMISGAAMVVVGFLGIWLGGHVFHLLVALICGLMVWELVGMLRPGVRHEQLQYGVLAGFALVLAVHLSLWLAVVVLLALTIYGAWRMEQNRIVFGAYCLMILLAGLSMALVRDEMGLRWMFWLVLVVVVTDVAGYFAGRMLGGPKFWPAISPKKTWSGTAAGWVAAALVGVLFSINSGGVLALVILSILLAFASQIGDIAESALKRKQGVKDSSTLIPGHGGLMDRFDGMLGASVFLLVVGFPLGWV